MKSLMVITVLLLGLSAEAQLNYQKSKNFYPYFSVGAGISTKVSGEQLWSGFDVGAQNKNTDFGFGVTTHLWLSGERVLYFAANRRLVYVKRLELWAGVSAATQWDYSEKFQFGIHSKILYRIDKALGVFVQANSQLRAPNFKYYGFGQHTGKGIGVRIYIPGRPHERDLPQITGVHNR